MQAGEAEAEKPRRRLVKWNEYDGPISTLRIGYGFLVDFTAYSQDRKSEQQVSLEPDVGLRDFRLLFKGRFKTGRPISWTAGVMYDGADEHWHFRQTGVMVAVPELLGSFFIGRTKEGYSLNKVMVGYDGWTIERYTANDAFVPILADGVKWLGYAPRPRAFWSLGYYMNALSKNESFSTNRDQWVARLGWQPVLSEEKVLHLALMGRHAHPEDDTIRPKSRPEAFLAPFFVDTGSFTADVSNTAGAEAYYRAGPWLFGSEYNVVTFDTPVGGDPTFHGGDAAVSWLITGETRAYNAAQGYFKGVSPKRTVFEGGPGAWEAVMRFSYIDLDSGALRGGKFWRITPMVNWHLSDNLRVDAAYGLGVLDRYGIKGQTQFFQLRLQTTL